MDSFSGQKYREVEPVFLWREDLDFLRSQPGYNGSIGREFCRSRRSLARRWVKQIRADFDRLYTQGQLILVNSRVDRPDLVRALFRLRLEFYRNLLLLHFRISFGNTLGGEIRALTIAFESLIGYTLIANEDTGALTAV